MHLCQSLISLAAIFPALFPALSPAAAAKAPAPPLRLILAREPDSPWPASAASCRLAFPDPEGVALTVTGPGGQTVPSSVLWAKRGQPLLLLFETTAGDGPYTARITPGGQAAPSGWLPQAGLIQETRLPDRPAFDSRAQFDQAWSAATGICGRGLKTEIFEGVHAFGPSEKFLARFDAWFRVGQAGDYGFATLSDDASFVSVDGKPVTEWPGIHGTDGGRLGEKNGTLRLEPGLHRLRYDVAQGEGLYAAIASWRKPGKKHFEVMQPADFERLAVFSTKEARTAEGGPAPAYFDWSLTRSARMEDALLVMASFRALVPPQAACRWTFGDGTTGDGSTVDHAYIGAGPRSVTLTVTRSGFPPATFTQPVDIQPVWRQIEECPDAALFPLREALQNRPAETFSPAELECVAHFARRVGDPVWLDRLADNVLKRSTGFSSAFRPVLHAMGVNARQALFRKYEAADKLFGLALALPPAPDGAPPDARIRLDRAENKLNGLGLAAAAADELARIPDDQLDPQGRRRKHLLQADAALALGRREESSRLVLSEPPVETGTLAEVHRQARIMTAADFIRREEWNAAADRLNDVLTDFPAERFNGETVLLLMQAEAGRGEKGTALLRGERLLQLDLLDDTRARLLLSLFQAYRSSGRMEAAVRCRELLKRDFPYSESAALADSASP